MHVTVYTHTRGVLHAEKWSIMVYFMSIFTLPPVSNDTIIYKAVKIVSCDRCISSNARGMQNDVM